MAVLPYTKPEPWRRKHPFLGDVLLGLAALLSMLNAFCAGGLLAEGDTPGALFSASLAWMLAYQCYAFVVTYE